MDPNLLLNMQRTVDSQKQKHLEALKSNESSQRTRSASPSTTNSSTSSKSSEKSKLRGFFRQWCPTDVSASSHISSLRRADFNQPQSIPGGKVDRSGGYFTYKLKEEPKTVPKKPQKKRCARQPHLEALMEE
jgi:hypothetical protein